MLIERSGIPVAAIVSASDLARLERMDKQREADFAVLDEIREAFKDVPSVEIEREIDQALAEVRAKYNES